MHNRILIKGDNSVNDTKIQLKLLDFQCGLSPKGRDWNDNYTFYQRAIKQLNNKNKNV